MKNDVKMQQEVLAELGRDQNVLPGSIGVEVHHGVVKLAGRVDDASIKENSKVAAHRVDGVTSVVMDVDVGGTKSAAL